LREVAPARFQKFYMSDFKYQKMFMLGPDDASYRKISGAEYLTTISIEGQKILRIAPDALTA